MVQSVSGGCKLDSKCAVQTNRPLVMCTCVCVPLHMDVCMQVEPMGACVCVVSACVRAS